MANFGDSFLDMAEAMLGKYRRPSSEVLTGPRKSTENFTLESERNCSDETDQSSKGHNSNTEKERQINTSDQTDNRRSIVVVTPPKRRRLNGNYSAFDAVHALNRAMSKVS